MMMLMAPCEVEQACQEQKAPSILPAFYEIYRYIVLPSSLAVMLI